MVEWRRDRTGRFEEYPHFEPGEIDSQCETVVRRFLARRRGTATYPLTTDELAVLIEEHVDDLDQGAALPDDIEGRTVFSPPGKPSVEINAGLQDARYVNRLRTTLAHEFGHVLLHTFMWEFVPLNSSRQPACNRDRMIGAGQSDWMEWQAGYASCSFLIPKGALEKVVGRAANQWLAPDSLTAKKMIEDVARAFDVSDQAAQYRLSVLTYILPRA